MSYYILYNPLAGGGVSEEKATQFAEKINAKDSLYNVINVDYKTLFTDSEWVI